MITPYLLEDVMASFSRAPRRSSNGIDTLPSFPRKRESTGQFLLDACLLRHDMSLGVSPQRKDSQRQFQSDFAE
jgi:hypothetical protein